MKYTQEYIAENLFEKLTNHFKKEQESIKITKNGAGVHWDCVIVLKNRKCKIHCFEHRHYDDIRPEYLISFEEAEENKAWGRTFDIEETILSSADWIHNKDLDFLYEQYEFIDWQKRRIQEIEKQLIKNASELALTENILEASWGSDLYDYCMNHNNRSCKLSGFGKTEPVSFTFYWEDCRLFELKQNDLSLLAEVVKKWLIDDIQPSVLEHQYDWIIVGDLAKYYEKGEGIKGEYIESWNSIEQFYGRFSKENRPFIMDALRLIEEMKSKGLHTELRAGQSLFSFILSRSRRHGLQENHPFIQIHFLGDNWMKVESSLDNNEETEEMEVKFGGFLEQKITQLLKEEIN